MDESRTALYTAYDRGRATDDPISNQKDPVVARQRNLSPYSPTTLVTLWAYDGIRGVVASVASSLRSSASAWLLTPTIMRMQDEKSSASLPRLSRTAICQAGKDMPGSRESTARKTQLYKHTKRFSTEAVTRNNNNGATILFLLKGPSNLCHGSAPERLG